MGASGQQTRVGRRAGVLRSPATFTLTRPAPFRKQEIITEGSGEAIKAVGVRLADGRVFRCGARVRAGAGAHCQAGLADGTPQPPPAPCTALHQRRSSAAPPCLPRGPQGQDGGEQRHAVGHF